MGHVMLTINLTLTLTYDLDLDPKQGQGHITKTYTENQDDRSNGSSCREPTCLCLETLFQLDPCDL